MSLLEMIGLVGGGVGAIATFVAGAKSFVDDSGALHRAVFTRCFVRPVSQGSQWSQSFAADVDWRLDIGVVNRGADARDLVLHIPRIEVSDWQGRTSVRSLPDPRPLQPMDEGDPPRRDRILVPPTRGGDELHVNPARLIVEVELTSRRSFGPRRTRRATLEIDASGAHDGTMVIRK